jgi:diguanylate cyclase (GGDEF)-like protein
MKELAAHIVALLRMWRYSGFTKDDVKSCKSILLRHNAVSLSVLCLVSAILIVILSFYPNTTAPASGQFPAHLFYGVFACIELAGFCVARYLCGKKDFSSRLVGVAFVFFAVGTAAFCVYVYVLGQSMYADRFLLVFLTFQIIFLFGPHINLLLNIGVMVLFFVVNRFATQLFGHAIQSNGYYDVLNIFLTGLISMTLNWYIAHVLIRGIITSRSLEKERNHFLEDSTHDQLTGLNNRRSYDQSIEFYTSVCRHVHQTVCVVMMDVDYFKLYNDFYGHQKGDVVLQSIGTVLKQISEDEHIFSARVGGEEFIMLWTENRLAEAERVVLKLRQMIIDLKIDHEKSTVAPYVTASFGLYVMRGGSLDDAADLYQAADSALYKAKESGRDRIVMLDSNDKSFHEVELRAPDEMGRR